MIPSFKTAFTALLFLSPLAEARPQYSTRDEREWVTVWGTMPQLVEPGNLPPTPFNETGRVFRDATLRQTVKVSLAASTLRLQISNAFGGSDLPITSVTIGRTANNTAGTSGVDANSLQVVTFSGSGGFVVPNGAVVFSDPINLTVEAQSIVSVTIYLANGQSTNSITGHPGSRTTSFLVRGNHVADHDLVAASNATTTATTTDHWYLISALEGWVPKGASAVAIVGDSISDGRGSTTNVNNRWPDRLLARMQNDSSTQDIAIVNEAAGGNRVLADGLGPNGLGRIDRDVVAQSGIMYAIVFIGVNDIGTAANTTAAQEAVGDRLIAAYDQIVTRLHRFNIAVFGATITPLTGDGQPYSDPQREKTRQSVNKWIRNSGRYDAVIDFDAIVRDPAAPEKLKVEYDSGDHLHLNPAGYKAMAAGINLSLFDKFKHGVSSMT
ncbi:GDSL-like Lipase/Acylhydrolase [Colletotrichum orchidophilum]|uniref:GDSL-like Lipase/Acylhydrolase n=1 Tax=Colletotrichum orchidophilum TaxID=1209926 RepID=A0A1G4B2U6_9PEZI|nr:GDSL-like Lipase/Acylhydrolase [Colletotrichum orchidophilum]OHE95748.1 GDSL-like Lipase/Acylhydrolase [Colletotrichum orchidophilum]